jgi:uncharacterized membrane protein YdbT with pleckstrin-like domain
MEQSFEDGVYYAPGKKVLYYFSITRILPVIIIFIILSLSIDILNSFVNLEEIVNISTLFLFVIGLLCSVIAFISAYIKYKSVEFMFDEFAFSIRKGFLSKSEISIPYRQVQFINHSQSFNDKILGVMNVIVETAGDDDSSGIKNKEGVLPILDSDIALSVEKELLRRSNVSNIDKTIGI